MEGHDFAPEDIWQCLETFWIVTKIGRAVLLELGMKGRHVAEHRTDAKDGTCFKECQLRQG